jgi:hypothetical protein
MREGEHGGVDVSVGIKYDNEMDEANIDSTWLDGTEGDLVAGSNEAWVGSSYPSFMGFDPEERGFSSWNL